MTKEDWQADSQDVEAVVNGRHANPFAFLGLHEVAGQWVLRAFIPHADSVSAFTLDGAELGHLIPR
ncbi:MAG: glgB, partial [Devosia sp.]|nr:glgB [Devosia sp.]